MAKAPMDDVALNQSYAHLVARVLVRPMLGTAIRPNHLTVLRMGIGLAACALLALGPGAAWIWSGVCWFVACLLDRADGELARMGDLRSDRGKVLDYYSDMFLDAGWFLGAGIGLRVGWPGGWLGGWAVPLGILTCCSMLTCSWSSEMFERASGPGVKVWYGVQRFHPDDALFLLSLFTWLGASVLAPILVAASVCTPVIALVITARYMALRRRLSPTRR